MKKWPFTLAALLLTGALVYCFPDLPGNRAEQAGHGPVIRVWITEGEKAVGEWLKKQAAAYEKRENRRVYLRRAGEEEASLAARGAPGALIPDLIVGPGGGAALARKGYALAVRDDASPVVTAAPTSALFFRPSPTPGPTPAPEPFPDGAELGAVLAPAEMAGVMPGTVASADPVGALTAGRARAALLTAGQIARLAVGCRVYALPEGRGLLPVEGRALTGDGEKFLAFLREEEPQRGLADFGLYALEMRLYSPDDPVRYLVDGSR